MFKNSQSFGWWLLLPTVCPCLDGDQPRITRISDTSRLVGVALTYAEAVATERIELEASFPQNHVRAVHLLHMRSPFFGVHIKGDTDIDVDIDTDS